MREDRRRWPQHSRAEGGWADEARDEDEVEVEERSICSFPISPPLESSMETAGGGGRRGRRQGDRRAREILH